MDRVMEYVKCIALLCKAYRMQLLTEEEYNAARNKLMDLYMVIQNLGS